MISNFLLLLFTVVTISICYGVFGINHAVVFSTLLKNQPRVVCWSKSGLSWFLTLAQLVFS